MPRDARRVRRGADPRSEYARYAGAGLQFALTFLVFGAAGWWLDGRLGSQPWCMLIGIALGATGGFISLVHKVPPPTGANRTNEPPPDR